METSILTLDDVLPDIQKHKKAKKKIGLITGCFGILHVGHLDLFEEAHEVVDIVVVGLERDETIKLNKGDSRPVNNVINRFRMLNSMECIDHVFLLDSTLHFGNPDASKYYRDLYSMVMPHYLISNEVSDTYWLSKKEAIESLGGKIHCRSDVNNNISTSKLLKMVMSL